MNHMIRIPARAGIGVWLALWLSLTCLSGAAFAAKPRLDLALALWSPEQQQLTVQGRLKNADGPVELFDLNGVSLGTASAGAFTFNIPFAQLGAVPCGVKVQAGTLETVKRVDGTPAKRCHQAPQCQITSPAKTLKVKAGQVVQFAGAAQFANPEAQVKYEWDFGGGAMGESTARNDAMDSYKRPDTLATSTRFVRDNSRYRIRFSARDENLATTPKESAEYRCEAVLDVIVGKPPIAPPGVAPMAKTAQADMPKLEKDQNGNPSGQRGSLVVLPYENLSMQCGQDARITPSSFVSDEFRYPALNAVAYRRDLKPPVVSDLKLRYSAASNPKDPAGPGSINSTSQNWPLGSDIHAAAAPLMDAATTIRKTDRWDPIAITAQNALEFWLYWSSGFADYPYALSPDQGFANLWGPNIKDAAHGLRMPGYDNPYAVNAAQDFTGYIDPATGSDAARGLYGYDPVGVYQARWLPLTDIDDNGQVNPFPLLRVQAFENAGDGTYAAEPAASVDAVQTSGRDFHCRGCHAKGKIGADPSVPWTAEAYQYSVWDNDANRYGLGKGHSGHHGGTAGDATPPGFFEAASGNVFDQEYAAIRNAMYLHEFYDAAQRASLIYDTPDQSGTVGAGVPCGSYCHTDNNISRAVGGGVFRYLPADGDADKPFPLPTQAGYGVYETNYSMNMHKWHGQLQYNDAQNGILRDKRGVPLRWDPAAHGPGETNTRSLFPVKDAKGGFVPMEENCLKCHAGQREQCYRDRMYTAGVTCYQCHGDMLAVGKAYPKKQPSSDGHKARQDWLDQPDCGSCHVGSANVGKKNPEFFSAGVRKLAFEADDPSATTRPVDHGNVDAARFAVPATPVELNFWDYSNDHVSSGTDVTKWRVDGPLYRLAKDAHGNVPCAACHGGTHAIWPNRDPKANDNLTALELQGHTGNILECNVCHDQESFSHAADLDGGTYSGDTVSGILGGPHNLHPVNDPYWWKEASGDQPNRDGTNYGGFHNHYAQQPGKAGEDQCAACHGNDHKGTRLSRTPVDRVFDFSGFDFAKLKQAGFTQKVVKVAAGTEIGCDTCHTVETSCFNSPAGSQCGQASEATTPGTTHPPVFTAGNEVDLGDVLFGSPLPYLYTPAVSGGTGPYTFGLSSRMESMTVDAATGQVTIPEWDGIAVGFVQNGGSGMLPKTYRFVVTVKDSKGVYASQTVKLNLACPAGEIWAVDPEAGQGHCSATNHLPVLKVPDLSLHSPAQVGVDFSTTLTSTDEDRSHGIQGPSYTLGSDAPKGMILGQQTGILRWTPKRAGTYTFTVNVGDHAGGSDSQQMTVNVCPVGRTYLDGKCLVNRSPSITSSFTPTGTLDYPYPGAGAGIPYNFTVTANDPDGDPLTFGLVGAPEGMTIDPATGVIAWTPTAAQGGGFIGIFSFSAAVKDNKGGVATESVPFFIVCASGTTFDTTALCVPVQPTE
jgi:hypothetical protein